MSLEKKRILCVDSNADISHLLTHLLSRAGYECRPAGSLLETALCLIAGEQFDLFIIGAQLTDGTVLSLYKLLRNYQPSAPVVFYSDNSDEPTLSEALATGVRVQFVRSGDFSLLVSVVRQLLTIRGGAESETSIPTH